MSTSPTPRVQPHPDPTILSTALNGASRRNRPGRGRLLTILVILLSLGLEACGSTPEPVVNPTVLPEPSTPASRVPEVSAQAVPSGGPSSAVPSPGTAKGLNDPCSLLPAALLSNSLNGETAFPKVVPRGGWDAGQCAWSGATSSFILRLGTAASITAFADPAAPDAKSMFAAFKQRASGAGRTKVAAGIGDGAVLAAGGMAAYLGGTYIEVTRLRLTDDQLVEIMRLAVANL